MIHRRRGRVVLGFSLAVLAVASLTSVAQAAAVATPLEIFRELPATSDLPQDVDLRTVKPVPDSRTATRPMDIPVNVAATDINTPAPIGFDECSPNPRDPLGGIFKNTFSTCQITDMRYQRYACPEATCPIVAGASARVIVIRNMQPAQRRVVISHQVVMVSYHGMPGTTRFGIGMTCGPRYTTGTAHCDVPEAKVTKSFAEWIAEPVELNVFTMRGEDVPNPADSPKIQAEKRTWYGLGRYLFIEGEPGETATLQGPPLSIGARCDVAFYAYGSKCVFPGAHTFIVDLREPAIAESGQLVNAALVSFASTYPGPLEGRYVAGNKSANSALRTYPVTRVYHDTAAQDANKAVAEQACATRSGPDWRTRPDGKTNECAVYPFNSTKDGANFSPGTSEGASFAVKPVLAADHQKMTETLNWFLGQNHILDGDQYWVWPRP